MSNIKVRVLALVMALCMVTALLSVTVSAATDIEANNKKSLPLPEDYNVPGTVQWSFPTITNKTVTQDTYSGKKQILIFFRADGSCGNSNYTISSLAEEDWITLDNVKVIAVGCGNSEENEQTVKENVISYKQQYAPACDAIEFCYATNLQMWTAIGKLQNLINENPYSITFAVSYIFDSKNNLRFTWQGSFKTDYYLSALSAIDGNYEAPSNYHVKINGTNDYYSAYAILDILNKYRKDNGLSQLTMDKDLLNTAMQRAAEIAVYYSHTRPDYSDWFTAFPDKFAYSEIRENIAAGYFSADSVMDGWKSSPGHNANMLAAGNNCVGIGAFVDSDGTCYWVQLFSSLQGTEESPRTAGIKDVIADVTANGDALDFNISPKSTTLNAGETAVFTASNTNVEWVYSTPNLHFTYAESSDKNIATVSIDNDGNAVVVPVGVGKATITLGFTATDNGKPITKDVAVDVISVSGTTQPSTEPTTDPSTDPSAEPSTEPSVLERADVNGDGKISAVDAKWILQCIAKAREFNAEQIKAADLNGDGKISVVDVKWVLQIIAGIREAETLELIK